MRRADEGKVALPGQETRGGIETDPARPRDIGLCPGVEIREVGDRPGRALQRRFVRAQLHQVARDEPGGEPDAAEDLHEQPGAVPARSDPLLERLVGRLHARFHAGRVRDRPEDPLVEGDEEVDDGLTVGSGRGPVGGPVAEPLGEQGAGLVVRQVRRQLASQRGVIGERVARRVLLDEEVERVDDREVGDEVDGDGEVAGRLGEHEARQMVAERVLLPVDEVLGGRDRQRVGEDGGAAVGRRPQTHDVG
jgi:hypothetical protein